MKEADWNHEADKHAVRDAAKHEVHAALKAQLKRQKKVPKLMQKTLLAIRKARTRKWQEEQIANMVDQADDDEGEAEFDLVGHFDAQLELKNILQNPSTALPRYCWEKLTGGRRHPLPAPPPRLESAKLAKNRHREHPEHLACLYVYQIFEPLYWFWASVEWCQEATASKGLVGSTSLVELAIAFRINTGITPAAANAGTEAGNTTMQQRVQLSADPGRVGFFGPPQPLRIPIKNTLILGGGSLP